MKAIFWARCGSAPIRPMSHILSSTASPSSPGVLNGTSLQGTPSFAAMARAMSGEQPSGSPSDVRPVTRRKFPILTPARSTPVGASWAFASAFASGDMVTFPFF